jgi:hypothetical protein
VTADMTGAASEDSEALIFNFRFSMPARGRRLAAMTAVVAAGLTLILASVALAGWPARAAVAAASFGRAVKLSLPLNSAPAAPNGLAFALSCSSFANCVAGGD